VAYQALYRKYRPQRFSDVVGQDHVTLTLAREVQAGKVAHAYLFAGPRGTGKTTTARITAKVLNCSQIGSDGEPCNQCPSCVAITEGNSLDVIELDAASHNKVEDVREIRANVGTVASVGGAHRVYILDEAHMLSRAAANALLKTLEEPPEHAYFVLATTEPYKLPDTIRSRAQRFDFHPIGSETLGAYIEQIARREGFETVPDGVALIARHARGSVRDALSLLEQVAALGYGKVDARGVTRALGLAPADAFGRLARALEERDAPGALGLVASIAGDGADLRRFVADAIEFFRGLFLARHVPHLEEIVDEPAEVLEEWRAYSKQLEPGEVLRAIDLLGDALMALREGREERLVVELTLLRLTRPETSTDTASLASRLERLEERVRWLGEAAPTPSTEKAPSPVRAAAPARPEARPAAAPAPRSATAGRREAQAAPERPKVEEAPPPSPPPGLPVEGLDLGRVEAIWPALVERVRKEAGPRRHALLRECRPAAVEGAVVMLEVPAHLPFHLAQLSEDDRLGSVIISVAGGLLGGTVKVAYRLAEDESAVGERGSGRDPVPNKDELESAGDDGPSDPAQLAVDLLGGSIVES
jgi:DNA polymerase-3 subunit gamma/tau